MPSSSRSCFRITISPSVPKRESWRRSIIQASLRTRQHRSTRFMSATFLSSVSAHPRCATRLLLVGASGRQTPRGGDHVASVGWANRLVIARITGVLSSCLDRLQIARQHPNQLERSFSSVRAVAEAALPGSADPNIRSDKVTLITRPDRASRRKYLPNRDYTVEVSGLEPPTSTLRTSFVHPPEQGLHKRTSWYQHYIPLTLPQISSHSRKIRSVKVTSSDSRSGAGADWNSRTNSGPEGSATRNARVTTHSRS